MVKCNKYGEANGVIKTNGGYIHYSFLENWNKFKEGVFFIKLYLLRKVDLYN